MNEVEDLTGKIFGKWTIIKRASNRITKTASIPIWFAICECGTKKEVRGYHLTSGQSLSCGCIRNINLIGKTFGNLLVLERDENKTDSNGNRRWICKCICGNIKSISGVYLKSGSASSCGCTYRGGNLVHGLTSSDMDIYNVWLGMMHRCYHPTSAGYDKYGGRGISVCSDWHNPLNFYKDMYPRPNNTTLDRINTNDHYYKDNCRWVDSHIQQNNKRNNIYIEWNGMEFTLAQWGRILDVNPETLRYRYNHNYPVEDILFKNNKLMRLVKRVGDDENNVK